MLDEKNFQGMNQDDEDRVMKPGQYRYALNVRSAAHNEDSVGTITNAKGNVLVAVTLPAGVNKVIGAIDAKDSDTAYYFLWNSNANHCIYKYSVNGNLVELVLMSPVLNFNDGHLINHANVVDGKLLYWTDGFNGPRKINIEKGIQRQKKYCYNIYFKGDITLAGQKIFTEILNDNEQIVASWQFTSPGVADMEDFAKAYVASLPLQAKSYVKLEACGVHVKACLNNNRYTIKTSGVVLNNTPNPASAITVSVSGPPAFMPSGFFTIVSTSPVLVATGSKVLLSGAPLINGSSYNGSYTVQGVFTSPGLWYIVTTTPVAGYFYQNTPGASYGITFSNVVATNAVAQNFYPDPLKLEFIDRGKWPPSCAPVVGYQRDTERKTNLVDKRIFQMRVRYIFDDNEKSAWGPISTMPIIGQSCTAATSIQNPYNLIEVDFDEARLNDDSSVSLIKRVEIAFREHNIGQWYSMVELEQHEFAINHIYKFYNDGVYTALAPQDTNKNFDIMPIVAGAQEYMAGRIFDGDILEGYDPVCVDAKLDVSYQPGVTGQTFSIFGAVFIRNRFSTGNSMAMAWHQPIYRRTNNGPIVFGGCYVNFAGDSFVNSAGSEYDQEVPLGGFVMYLAGTDYYAVTRQRDGNTPLKYQAIPGLPGVYDASVGGGPGHVRNEIIGNSGGANFNPFGVPIAQNGTTVGDPAGAHATRVFSTFEIKNVPPGTYILRVASHKTTDLSNKNYQKSSTTVYRVGGEPYYECVVTVTNSNVYVGYTEILDITQPTTAKASFAIGGYVTDKDVALPVPVTATALLSDTRIPMARVELHINNPVNTTGYNSLPVTPVMKDWGPGGFNSQNSIVYTDHNGFFFYTRGGLPTAILSSITIVNIESGINKLNPTGYKIDGTQPFVLPVGGKAKYGIFRNSNQQVSDYSRTFIDGQVLGGAPINVLTLMTKGGEAVTDPDGSYSLLVYANTYNYTGQSKRIDNLIFFYLGRLCIGYVNPDNSLVSILVIGPSNYNYQTHFNQPSVTLFTVGSAAISAFKRGFEGELGLVYYDNMNRSTTVNTSESLELTTLFYTEKPNTPTGLPIVSWSIHHRPPNWATHYQWVRTKNQQLSDFLQFTAGEVQYVDSAETPVVYNYSDSRVRYARVYLKNLLVAYKDKYYDNTVAYSFQKGDRIRFIKNQVGQYYKTYEDFEVLKELSGFVYLYKDNSIGEIKPGTLFEIYSPRRPSEQKIFYEFGECFDIIETLQGKMHGGEIAQTATTPASGLFTTGDVYYRLRDIPHYVTGSANPVFVQHFIEDPSISDFYLSKDEPIGRINIFDTDSAQIHRERAIRFSDIFIRGTKVNGLSSYQFLNEAEADKGEGPIYKLQVVGNIMLAMQRATVHSMYINEKIYADAVNNQQTIAISDKVIGDIRPLQGVYGTTNPESVVEYAGSCYFFDKAGGNVIRYNLNGLFPVSDYKMVAHFKNKAKAMMAHPEWATKAIAAFDPFFGEYVLTFRKSIPFSDDDYDITFKEETLSFSDKVNMWISFHVFIPDKYTYVGMNLLSFTGGNLYIHNANNTYNNFYGVQHKSIVKTVANLESGKVKVFIALSQESNDVWSCPEIEIPPSAQYPQGMLSRLLASKFRRQEGVYYSDLMQDLLTPNFATQLDALINGRDLRGHVLIVTMENGSTEFVKLNALNVKYITSYLSKRTSEISHR